MLGRTGRPRKEPGYEVLAVAQQSRRRAAGATNGGGRDDAPGVRGGGAGDGRGGGAGRLRAADGDLGGDDREGPRRGDGAHRRACGRTARAGWRLHDHRLPGSGRRAQVGGGHARGPRQLCRGPYHRRYREEPLRPDLEELICSCWWGAVANVARATGNLDVAEDSVQEACVVAVEQWTAANVPGDPQAWLSGVARHKAFDRLRRESRRQGKEAATSLLSPGTSSPGGGCRSPDEDLWLIYLCCHPALDPAARIALPLPRAELLDQRTADVLKVVYLIFTEGHVASSGEQLLRADLCVAAVNLARGLAARLPENAEGLGLLTLLLLTDPGGLPAPTTPEIWSCSKTKTGPCGTRRGLMRARAFSWRRCGWPNQARTSYGRPSQPATPPRPTPSTPTGGRSPSSTANCCGTTRARSSKRTEPSLWPWRKGRRRA